MTISNHFRPPLIPAFRVHLSQRAPIRLRIDDGVFNITSLTSYADNAAALAAGLVAGDLYKTATGTVMVVYTP